MTGNKAESWELAIRKIEAIRKETAKIIVGQEAVIDQMLVALLCRGHCLIVGVPGLAKTLLVSTFGRVLGLTFKRIQFTPDLMPSDIIGSEILQESDKSGARRFEFVPGPLFANLILADEINRTPPKTQAALLEAMQEKQVTVAGRSMALDKPFIVFATQNPIEHEGTYPLPEAQLDRFFFNIIMDYPTPDEELEVVLRTTGKDLPDLDTVVQPDELAIMQDIIPEIPIPDHVLNRIMRLVQSTRPENNNTDDYIKKYVSWGAGPRAAQFLTLGAKALAMMRRNPTVSLEEVAYLAPAVLRHRIIPSYNATGEGIDVEEIIAYLMARDHEI